MDILLECECCGGTFIKVKEGEFKCDHCGYVKYVETATSSEIITLLNQANSLRNKGEFDDAYEIYESIVQKDGNNPEGYWGLFLSEYGIMHVEDPKTKKYVPTCNRASISPVTDDLNLKKALELSNGEQKQDLTAKAEQIEKIRDKILTLSKSEDPYDVFICYKRTASNEGGKETYTEDAQQARDIYDILSGVGYKVFFAEKTLQGLAGAEYEPIIFNALNTAKVMLVVCSDINYINAPWVKNEWRRFIKQMEFDESKKLIPVMTSGMKAGRLPDLLKKYQGLEVNVSFKDNLLASLKRNIDAMRKNSIERVKLEGIKANKKVATINNDFQVRKIGTGTVSQVVASDEKLLKIGFNYMGKGMKEDAKKEFAAFADRPEYEKMVAFLNAWLDKEQFTSEVIEKFNDCIPTVSAERAEQFFGLLEGKFKALADSFQDITKRSEPKTKMLCDMYETLMAWDRPNKAEFSKTLHKLIIGTRPKHLIRTKIDDEFDKFNMAPPDADTQPWKYSGPLITSLVKCYDPKDVDGYIDMLRSYGMATTDKTVRSYCFKKILEVDEGNIDVRYKAFKEGCYDLNLNEGETLTKDYATNFKNFLRYVEEKDRKKYIGHILKKAADNTAYDGDFDEIIKLLPADADKSVKKFLHKRAQVLQHERQWKRAIHYYELELAEDDKDHKPYWGILLCKMECRDSGEIKDSLHSIDKYPEFNSAVRLAPDEEADRYISYKQAQQAVIGSNRKERAVKTTKRVIGKTSFGLGVVAVIIAILGGIGLLGWGGYALVKFFQPIVKFVAWDGTVVAELKAEHWFGAVDTTQIDTSGMTKPDDLTATDYKFFEWEGNIERVWHRETVKATYKGDYIYRNLYFANLCGDQEHHTFGFEVGSDAASLGIGEIAEYKGWYGLELTINTRNLGGDYLITTTGKVFKKGNDQTYVVEAYDNIGFFLVDEIPAGFVAQTTNEFKNISTVEDLKALSNTAGNFKLVNNIDLSSEDWTPIKNFMGYLDGNGFEIQGLRNGSKTQDNYGLFESTLGATLYNVKLTNVQISISGEHENIGALAGQFKNSFAYGCEVQGAVYAPDSTNVGGMFGKAVTSKMDGIEDPEDENVTYYNIANVNVTGGFTTGGVIGFAKSIRLNYVKTTDGTVVKSNKLGETGNYVGGIIAHLNPGVASKYNGEKDRYTLSLSNLENNADIQDGSTMGGVVGYIEELKRGTKIIIDTLANYGDLSSTKGLKVGGIFGTFIYDDDFTIENVTNVCTINVDNYSTGNKAYIGGIWGFINSYLETITISIDENTVTFEGDAANKKEVGCSGAYALVTIENITE